MAWGDGITGNVFETLGTTSLSSQWSDGFGGNGVSLAEAADLANGSYDYGGTAGGIMYQRDAVEQQRMAAGYPLNGQSWDWNAATLGISRLLDSGARAYATANGTLPATYAGQNGLTYVNGKGVKSIISSGNMLPLLVIGVAVVLLATSK